MNRTETVMLCRLVKALSPSQAIDEMTPDAWHVVLWDIDLEDAKTAVGTLVREGRRYVEAGDIYGTVRRIRRERVAKFGPVPVPGGLEEAEYRAWLRKATHAIASGQAKTPDDLGMPALAAPDQARMTAAIEAAMPSVNEEEW